MPEAQARLIVVRGVADPASFEFGNSQCVTLGRSTESTIVLQDAHASRQHAQVYFDAGHWYLRDCGGRNGTQPACPFRRAIAEIITVPLPDQENS